MLLSIQPASRFTYINGDFIIMANEIKIGKAILAINADAKYTFTGDDADTIEWIDGTVPIAKADILTKQAELQAEYDALDYARARELAYPITKEFIEAFSTKECIIISQTF